jgi:lipopolysaccharide export system protein LptC
MVELQDQDQQEHALATQKFSKKWCQEDFRTDSYIDITHKNWHSEGLWVV